MQHLTCAIQEIRAHHERSERTDDYKRSITHTISDRYAPVCPHKTFPDPLSMIKALFRRNAGHLQFRGKLLNRNEIFVQYIRLKKPECEDYQRHPLICLPSSLHIILHVAEEHWISDFANLIGTFVHAQLLPISPNSNLVNALPNAKILQRAEIKVTSDEEIINLEDLEELEGFKLYWVSKEEADSRSHPIIKKARKDIIDSVPKSVYSFVESSLDALRCTKLEMQELHIPSMTTFAPFTQLLQANRPFSYQSLNLRQKSKWSMDQLKLAKKLATKGDSSGSIRALNACLQLDPANSIAYFERGKAHLAMQRTKQAISDFKVALRIDPKNIGAQELLWKLERRHVQ